MELNVNETTSPANLIRQMLGAYENAQLIYVAAKLGIADFLSDGPRYSDDLANIAGLNADALRRVMRGLVNRGILTEVSSGNFGLTPSGECLKKNELEDWNGIAINVGELLYSTWGSLLYSVQTGKPAFEHVHGMKWFEYLEKHPEQGQIFNNGMANDTQNVAIAVCQNYDFSKVRTIADIGGGQGILLSQVLNLDPQMQGLLFDAASVLANAPARLEKAGVSERCEMVAGNFFESVPSGCDAYMLKSIIHDWNDEESIQILKNVRASMEPDARLLMIEPILPERVEDFSVAVEMDLGMLLLLNGRERTVSEYRSLYEAVGLELIQVIDTGTPFCIIEGKPIN
ncbi:methyltransferase [Shewanella sp. WE21]|nr:methyltransferase [Shewanella sp. WE21]